jgi:hypothetical protein
MQYVICIAVTVSNIILCYKYTWRPVSHEESHYRIWEVSLNATDFNTFAIKN